MAGISFIATAVVRFFQILFAVVVLGLSVTMAKWQVFGDAPATTVYGAFSGGFALLVGLIGAVAIFLDAIPAIIVAGADGLAAVLTLAAGIVSAPRLLPHHDLDGFAPREKIVLIEIPLVGLRRNNERRQLR